MFPRNEVLFRAAPSSWSEEVTQTRLIGLSARGMLVLPPLLVAIWGAVDCGGCESIRAQTQTGGSAAAHCSEYIEQCVIVYAMLLQFRIL